MNPATAEPAARPATGPGENPGVGRRRPSATTLARAAAVTLVGGLTTWMGFSSGGYFADTTALATIALILAVLLLVMLKHQPLAQMSRTAMIAVGALILLTGWILLSAQWSGTPTRTLHDYQRSLLYLLCFALFACLPHPGGNARWLVRAVAVGLGAATLAGLAARLEPSLGEALSVPADERLNWPLGYWNSLGLAGAFAIIACLHGSSDLDEPRISRVLAAAAVPALAIAVFLTLSRGAILAGAIGIVVALLLARGRGTPTTLIAVLAPTGWALLKAYDAPALTDFTAGEAATARAGAELLRVLLLATAAAAILRVLGLFLDARLQRARLWRRFTPARSAIVVLAAIGLLTAAGLAANADSLVQSQYDDFLRGSVEESDQERDRLVQASANGRIEHWEVALEAWREAPLIGHGAGSYARDWALLRPFVLSVQDAHSLFFETLSELGLVGLVLLTVALLAPLVAMLRRRMSDRVLWSAVLALYLTWLVRAAADWDWEMPALTLPIFALAGAACARDGFAVAGGGRERRSLRLLAGLAVLFLLVTPVRIASSQRNLEAAVDAFAEGRCDRAISSALASVDALNSHPAPFEILGFCDVRVGRPELGIRMLEAAIRREPDSWELHYGLGLVRAAAGKDPRPALRRARRLNPREPLVLEALEKLDTARPAAWRRIAQRLPVIVPTR